MHTRFVYYKIILVLDTFFINRNNSSMFKLLFDINVKCLYINNNRLHCDNVLSKHYFMNCGSFCKIEIVLFILLWQSNILFPKFVINIGI